MAATEATDPQAAEAALQKIAKLQYAVKTALSLTLAYMIPMAMGWPQPQTAATTVMLIAATGAVSESLQKGVMRIIGSVAGAIIGLSLIALFPQERMIYLLVVSTTVALIIYLYNAYQGDSTVFLLTAVTILMVFNGGDAEGSFLMGVDRAFMTAFGVIVYTVVASMLWPVHPEENTEALASMALEHYRGAFRQLVSTHTPADTGEISDESIGEMLTAEESFQAQLATVKDDASKMAAYVGEWNAIASAYQRLQSILLPALQRPSQDNPSFQIYISNYDILTQQVSRLFSQAEAAWAGERPVQAAERVAAQYQRDILERESHSTLAAVATRAELLEDLQDALVDLLQAMNSLLFDQRGFKPGAQPQGKPSFVWLDLENFKTSLRSFITFWLAAAIWIAFNPPGASPLSRSARYWWYWSPIRRWHPNY